MELPVTLGPRHVGVPSAAEAALQVIDDLLVAFDRHDADEFAALFAPDAWFVNVLGYRLTGRGEIGEAHRYLFATVLAESRITGTDVTSRSISDNVALVEVVWSSSDHGTAPDAATDRVGLMILTLQRDEHGRWAIIHCANSEYPGN